MLLRKAFDSPQEHLQPTETDLGLIRKLALREVKEEEVWVGRMHLANDRVDRAHERFPVEYLERFAETLPGKSLMGGHNYDTLPLGRFYKSTVQKDEGGNYLDARYYLPADSPLVPQIELGVLKGSSIGYNAGKRVCDLCEKAWSPYGAKDGCEHWPGGEFDGKTCTLTYCPTEAHKAEAMEGSFVWAPCQPGAEAIAKSFDDREVRFLKDLYQRLHGTDPSGQGDPKVKTLEEVQQELLETKDAHQKALGDVQKQLQELKKAAEDGATGRDYLKSEIARMAGLLDMEETYAPWLEQMKDASWEALYPVFEKLGKQVDQKFSKGVAHTDGAPDPDETKQRVIRMPWERRRALG